VEIEAGLWAREIRSGSATEPSGALETGTSATEGLMVLRLIANNVLCATRFYNIPGRECLSADQAQRTSVARYSNMI
jgi:hypothetical protein